MVFLGASCQRIVDDKSAHASEAGQSTIVLGSCNSEFKTGWDTCLIENATMLSMPTLRFVMTNPGDYAVGDCELGLYKTGSVEQAGVVEIDLSGLTLQLKKQKLCILKIETSEKYSDPLDTSQKRSIYMRGGLFIELVEPGYFPTPTNDVVSFCVKVARTTKGRTKIENCVP